MYLSDLQEFKEVIAALDKKKIDNENFRQGKVFLKNLYMEEVDQYITKTAADGNLFDRIKDLLKGFSQPVDETTQEIPAEEAPAQMEEQSQQSPIEVVRGYRPYQDLAGQAEEEENGRIQNRINDLTKKTEDYAEPFGMFDIYVEKVMRQRNRFTPTFVRKLQQGWQMITEAITDEITVPLEKSEQQLEELYQGTTRKTYPEGPTYVPEEVPPYGYKPVQGNVSPWGVNISRDL